VNRPTELRNTQRELYYFRWRLGIAAAGAVLLFTLLAGRFFFLQVTQYEYFHTLAENNRISIVPVVPNRGLILDRNGIVLAHNYSAYTLEITPSKIQDMEATINGLATLVDIQQRDRKRFRRLLEESRNFESLPIRARLNDIEVARFAANRFRFPGVDIKARLFRHYPKGELASHAIGHIGRINEADLDQLEASEDMANYRGSDHIGKLGVEQSYEKQLHGVTGFEQVETDAGGHAIRTLSRRAPVSGSDLTLTLDSRLQEVADKAFEQYRGALVAIDPKNGEVLAFISKPGFDPNLFIDGIDPTSWDALNNSPDKPLNNRALRGQYPPGSTFKPFMALAGLELGKRTPSYTISDPGFFTLPGNSHHYRDWKTGGHGTVDLYKSIVISCDTYYYRLANDLGPDNIFNFIGQFGFGKKTGIDIEGETTGLLPSREWKMKRYHQKWYAGDTISVGIGQGYNLATPLQLAFATAILANNGTVIRPHLVRSILDAGTNQVRTMPAAKPVALALKPENLELVKKAMIAVTQPGGTAARVGAGAPYLIAGKTGTAQNPHGKDHSWFVGYAPSEDPRIVVCAIVENAGHGSEVAAPLVSKVIKQYLMPEPEPPIVKSADSAKIQRP